MTVPLPARLVEPIELPTPPPSSGRRPFPLLASLVPVAGALLMWRVTGSAHMLWFAALGPLMAIASLLDGARTARRERRRAQRELAVAAAEAEREVDRRHEEERSLLRAALPDVAGVAEESGRVWRRGGPLVVGAGRSDSAVGISGGEGERVAELRERARALDDAPVSIAWEGGLCVRGDGPVARAIARAVAVQLLLREPASAVRLLGAPLGEDWADELPHRALPGDGARRVAIVRATERIPPDAETVIVLAAADEPVPPECAALLEVGPGMTARLARPEGDAEVRPEAISLAQARAIGRALGARSRGGGGLPAGRVRLADVRARDASEHDAERAPAGLRAVVGVGPAEGAEERPPLAILDLVSDGPHAVVVGTTGAGKSEFLVTWVVAMAGAHRPDQLVLLLADFKGGTAFEPLRALPHVTGVLTDLDGARARRAVEGLRAEIRRRESAIANAGARDASDPRVGLARLVIVVDEFAALLQEHPDLHAVFSDVAARGRALGMHLVLGTQRAAGVVRDALIANCPLRVSLRVAEASESRAIVGTDAAARIPGDAEHRGVGLVRRAGDAEARQARFALTAEADVERVREGVLDVEAAPGPLLPELPEVWRPRRPATEAGVVIALADEPARQRQSEVSLAVGRERGLVVLGGAGAGKTAVAAWVAHTAAETGARVSTVPRDREAAWDALERAETDPPDLLVVDDADALLARFPQEHAQLAGERLESIVRDAGATGTTIMLTGARLTGALARIAEIIPRRAVLAYPTRAEHTGAGARGETFDPARRPGRGVLSDAEVQFALGDGLALEEPQAQPARWRPTAPITGLVLRAARRRASDLARAWEGSARVLLLDDLPPGAPLEDGGGLPLVLAGEGDGWQRSWGLLQRVRSEGDLVVGADCASEMRTVAGERELPPYARPRAARAWLLSGDRAARRIVLP